MATYSLMDGAGGRPGPTGPAVSAFSGNFIAGTIFKVTSDAIWLNGYRLWVPSGGDTTARKFALWQLTDNAHGVNQQLVPAGTVTSGTLTANSFNFVPLSTPIGLSKQVPYVACYGYVATAGFPDTQNTFGAGNTYAAGITNGPLFAYSDQGASAPEPFTSNYNQGLFSTAGSDPTTTFPATGDVHSNFWIDVQVTDVAPVGATYKLFPNEVYGVGWVNDTANNFTLGVEISLSQACSLNKIWFYSQAGVTQLPTRAGIWTAPGASLIAATDQPSPSWSGAAGSGWVSISYTGVTLAAGHYKVTVLNAAGVPAIWNATTNGYWDTGPGGATGITNGPLSAPNLTNAMSPGQDTFNAGASFVYPGTYAAGAAPNYWLDLEVTPLPAAGSLLLAAP